MRGTALSDITGADRGFNVGADVLTHTADGVSLATVYAEIQASLEEWNRSRGVISRLFTFDTTDPFAQLAKDPKPGEDFEEESEFGQPKAARIEADWLRMGYPLNWYDSATRFTRRFLRDVTADQLATIHADRLEADTRLTFRKTLSALTDKTVAGSRKTNKEGYEVFDLWDGSAGETPKAWGGKTFTGTHNHYLVSGAATVDSADLEQLILTIQEHGYGIRESNERIVLMMRKETAIPDAIRGFRRGVENNNSAVAKYDFIASDATPAYLTAESIIGSVPPGTWNDLPIFGSYGDALLFESYWIPEGYVIALATSGAGSVRNPLAFRQHANASLHGLLLTSDDTAANYPLQNKFYTRGFGVGVRNRSAAAVMQIKASGNYENPTWP
ncbi:hypothetical protein [uncultured Microbacterium sp.]|uniref:hypothetical protein n=1 Tax=uncultured Microbacterium sp. TaxID=191216 RepID=UPI0025F05483|nr:hypothetical protein [uncultured Microbacterium sp.]